MDNAEGATARRLKKPPLRAPWRRVNQERLRWSRGDERVALRPLHVHTRAATLTPELTRGLLSLDPQDARRAHFLNEPRTPIVKNWCIACASLGMSALSLWPLTVAEMV